MNVAGNIVTTLCALSLISCGTTTAPIHPPRDVRAASSPSVNRVDTSSYSAELAEATKGIFSWSRIRDRNITVDLHITGWKRPGQTRAEPIIVTEEWKPEPRYYFGPLLVHESRKLLGDLPLDPCRSSLQTGDGALILERTESDDAINLKGLNGRHDPVEFVIDKATNLLKEHRFTNDKMDLTISFDYAMIGQQRMLSRETWKEKMLCKSPYDTITRTRTFEYTTIDGLLLPAKVVTSELRKPRPEIKWEEKMETIEYIYANYRIEPVAK